MASVPRRRAGAALAPRRTKHLRVIEGGRDPRSRPRVRPASSRAPRPSMGHALRAGAAVAIVFAAFVFGLVLLHVLLAQSAFRLQGLQEKVRLQEARHREMRYRVATSESPARVAEAAENIGLVVATEQRYLLTNANPAEGK